MRLYARFPFQLMMLLIGFISIAGCGSHSDLVPVSGQITIDGKPLASAQITVFPDGHRVSLGKTDNEGRFTLTCYKLGDGAPVGQHIATVTAVQTINDRANRWLAPKKYADKATGVWVTIDGPTKDLKVELTWAGSNQNGPFVDQF
jgi:hypothetical protein